MSKRRSHMIAALSSIFGDKPVEGAEIGVFRGDNAISILRNLNVKKLYLIDPYDSDDPEWPAVYKSQIAPIKEIARKNLEPYSDRVEWLYMRSRDAVNSINTKLDFVYIDGNHTYDYVRRDIDDYLPLIKPSGYIGGHDYGIRLNPPLVEVERAVDDFVLERQYDLKVSDEKIPDWWFPKLLVHFIWFGPDPLKYTDYLALRTASKVYGVAPYLWTDETVPENEWLEKIKEFAVQKPLKDEWWDVLRGNKECTHRSNYLRCRILHDFGGFYLDNDTLCIKPIFDLDLSGLVIGSFEGSERVGNGVMFVEDLGNPALVWLLQTAAGLFAVKGNELSRWTTGPKLLCKGTRKPKVLKDITIQPKSCFYHYYPRIWRCIFDGEYPLDDEMYVLHWWNGGGKHKGDVGRYVKELVDEEYVRTSNSLYARIVRGVLGDEVC